MNARTCTIEGCGNIHEARGLCLMHYWRLRRHASTDKPPPRARSGVASTCAVEGCSKPKYNGRYCSMHKWRIRKFGSPGPAGAIYTRAVECSIAGCPRPGPYTRGLCGAHYARLLRYGDPTIDRRRVHVDVPCGVEGCEGMARRGGWCAMHYSRLRRNGSIEKPIREKKAPKVSLPKPPKAATPPKVVKPGTPRLTGPASPQYPLAPPRWPDPETPEACIYAIRHALHRCGNDGRAARRMLDIPQATFDLWCARARNAA